MDIKTRFFNKIYKTPTCWLWIGAIRGGDCKYGNIRMGKKRILAHRLSWEIHFGKIPINKLVLHKCDNPACVNPEHLFIGTQLDNIQDRVSKDRSAKGKTHKCFVHPELVYRGESCHFSRLTEKDVKEIRRKYIPRKYSTYKLAKEYNVTATCIYAIVRNISWKHIH